MNNVFVCLSKLNSNLRLLGNVALTTSTNNLKSRVKHFSHMDNQGDKSELLFKGTEDRFRGITVDTLKEQCSTDIFPKKLEDSLKLWISTEKRGIWFKVALEHSEWVPILAKNGFDFHHANNGFVMMYRWLPSTVCGIPSFAHTMVAVGALVLNDKLEVLAVQEKHFITEHWKFPGGVVEPGENLIDAAIREVKEETNIDCEFRSLVSLTHAPKGMFGCTDLYLIMGMHALSTDIKACEREIAKCQWIHIDEYVQRDDVTHFNKSLISKYLEYQKNGVRIGFEEGIHKISNRSYVTYRADMTQFQL